LSVNKRLRTVLLVSVLLILAVVLSGCVAPTGAVNLEAPSGWWEAIFVFPIAKALIWLSAQIASLGLPHGLGWAIILITLLIKVVTLPLTRKQLESQKAMQNLQPRIKELQDKYGKDRQKFSEEQMKLYKEAGVNPLGGCLPLLVQMPVLWALYQALYAVAGANLVPEAQRIFMWIPDLFYPTMTVGTNWLGESFTAQNWGKLFAYASLPIIMLVTQLALQKMSQAPKSKDGGKGQDPQAQMMGQMMFFMPIMFGYITLGLPAGLTLYWTVSNILSIVQQYFVAGWGGLADWLALVNRLLASQKTGTAAIIAPEPEMPSTALDKPAKRNRRRR
jgi:YidC/Oxa1 family membrane protein insertase